MKKLICLILSFVLLSAFSVISFAEAASTISTSIIWDTVNGENVIRIQIEGTLEGYENEKVLIKLLREGVDEADSSLSYKDKYALVDMAWTDENGYFSIIRPFSDDSDNYTIKAISDTMDIPVSDDVFIPSATKMDNLLNGLMNGIYTKITLAEELTASVSELGLFDAFLELSENNKQNVSDYIINNLNVFDVATFNQRYLESLFVKGIAPGEKPETVMKILDMYIDNTSIKSNSLYENYNSSDKLKTCSYMTNYSYNTVVETENGFFRALALTTLNSITSFNQITGIVTDYQNYINQHSATQRFINLYPDVKDKVNVKIAPEAPSFKTVESFLDRLNEFISIVEIENSIPALPAPGGGGGGGGGNGGSSGYTPEPATPSVSLDKIEDETASVFSDVLRSHWGYNAIISLHDKNIISGRTSNTFAPDEKITRAEFAKLIVSAMNLKDKSSDVSFSDVNENDWYFIYVNIAVSNGIIKGTSETTFAPNVNITRQDAAVMISRLFQAEETVGKTFGDDDEIAEYAKQAVYSLQSKKIISGYDGRFNPMDNLTRAQAAVMINNLLNIEE